MSRALWTLIALATLSAACESSQAKARREFQTRLKQEARLTPEEVRRWYEQIAPVIAGKSVQVREGAISRTLDNEQRLAVLGVLSDPDAVYDGGLRLEGNAVWRGLKAGATPVLSELDATQTLWIDVETFLPRRYEFEYSSPGFGDYAYELTFSK